MVIKRFKDFINTTLYENNDLSKSQTALDKFGMSNWDELPYTVQEACKKAGLKFKDSNTMLDSFGIKNYSNWDDNKNDSFWAIVGMIKKEGQDFNDKSNVCLLVSLLGEDNIGFNITDERHNPENVILYLNNMEDIMDKIVKLKIKYGGWNKLLGDDMTDVLKEYGIDGNYIDIF